MQEKIFVTRCGEIHYWIGGPEAADASALVFLPGLTADHRLFEKQTAYFETRCRILVWDAPAHAASWPFRFDFTLMDKAQWLDEILIAEGITQPVLVGQSMGGYVSQAYIQRFPGKAKGFVCIDSAPLQRSYMTAVEIWLLKHMEPVYAVYPWKALLKSGSDGVAETQYGKQLMHDMMMTYDGDQKRYAKISGHGFRILAEAVEAKLPYEIDCKALLICGEKDRAGSAKHYNRVWQKKTGLPMRWIPNAGHNANTDAPELINGYIEELLKTL